MELEGAVSVTSHDLAVIVDPLGAGTDPASEIDRAEAAPGKQKAVPLASGDRAEAAIDKGKAMELARCGLGRFLRSRRDC